jgi:hypothetical protein
MFYKWVRKAGEARLSFVVEGDAEVAYLPGGWASAPAWLLERGYGLTMFDNLGDAEKFARGQYPSKGKEWELWEVELDGEMPLPDGRAIPHLLAKKILIIVGSWPDGTAMARRVKLVRRVSRIRCPWVSGAGAERERGEESNAADAPV